MKRTLVFLALSASLSACVTTKEEGRQLRSDVEYVREQLSSFQRDSDAEREEFDKDLAKMERRVRDLESTLRSLRQSDADGSVQMEKVIAEVQILRGDIEDARFQLGETKKSVKDILERPPVEVAAAAEAPKLGTSKGEKIGGQEVPASASAHFDFAKELTNVAKADKSKLSDALAAWDLFLERHKGDAKVADAHYQRGQTLFYLGEEGKGKENERQYRKAILAFQKVLESGKNKNVAAAMFQIGMSFEKLGYYDNAVVFYDTLIKEHSRSKQVKAAKARLKVAKREARKQKKKK